MFFNIFNKVTLHFHWLEMFIPVKGRPDYMWARQQLFWGIPTKQLGEGQWEAISFKRKTCQEKTLSYSYDIVPQYPIYDMPKKCACFPLVGERYADMKKGV